MKKALIMIPAESVSGRQYYVQNCIEEAIKDGFLPVIPCMYQINAAYQDDFVKEMVPVCDVVMLFIDFGVDKAMYSVIESIENKEKLKYKRLSFEKLAVSPAQILAEVAHKSGIKITSLLAETRKRAVVNARFVYFRRAREYTKATLAEIGLLVGKDHASVMYGIDQAMTVVELIELYDEIYGDTKIKKEAVAKQPATAKEFDSQPVTRPVLPFRSLDKREQEIQNRTSVMCSVREDGFGGGFRGYRPHNS